MFARHVRPLGVLLGVLLAACGVAAPPRSAPEPAPAPVIQVRPGAGSGVQLPTPTVPPTADPLAYPLAYPLGYPWPAPATPTPTLDPTAEEATFIAEIEGPRNLPYQTPVPQGPLLRSRWPAPPADTATHTLIASRGAPTSFWAFDLRDPSQRHEISRPVVGQYPLDPVQGELSPDGSWIAYLVWYGEAVADLRIVRRDGKDDRLLARTVGTNHHACAHSFVWSPDGSQIAFLSFRRGPNGWAIVEVYRSTPATDAAPERLGEVFGAALIGWADATHLLLIVAVDPVSPLQLESLDTMTGQREVLGVAPTTEGLSCAQLAPNRQAVLLRYAHREYRVDLATRTWQEFDLGAGPTVWSPDSHQLLKVPSRGDAPVLLFDLDTPTTPLTLTLMPTYTAETIFRLIGGSPDGQYLLLCAGTAYDPINRTLLYAVARHHWELLLEESSCLTVIGWLSGPTGTE